MIPNNTLPGQIVIIGSIVISLLFAIYPLPESIQSLRPNWPTLVLIYWCINLPERVGIATGWIIGLLLDLLMPTTLGLHALVLSIIAYLTLYFYRRIRHFPLWQQAIIIFLLISLQQLLLLWLRSIFGDIPLSWWSYWLNPFSSALCWPLIYFVLYFFQRYYRIQ